MPDNTEVTYIIPAGEGEDADSYETRLTFAGQVPAVHSRQDQIRRQFNERCLRREVRAVPDGEWQMVNLQREPRKRQKGAS